MSEDKCSACHKTHYGPCKDKSVPLSKRMRADVAVDGDRIADYWAYANAKAFAGEVLALEKKLQKLAPADPPADREQAPYPTTNEVSFTVTNVDAVERRDWEQVRREALLAGALHFQHGWDFEERLPVSRIVSELRRLAADGGSGNG